MKPLLTHEEIKRVCPGGHQQGKEWVTTCPVPKCRAFCLHLFKTGGVKCEHGCTTAAVTAEVRKLLAADSMQQPAKKPTKKQKPLKPYTPKEFATDKEDLPLDYLEQEWDVVGDRKWMTATVACVSYPWPPDNRQYRFADGEKRFEKDKEQGLYGVEYIDKGLDYSWVVEGATNCHALAFAGQPVTASPSCNWQPAFAKHLAHCRFIPATEDPPTRTEDGKIIESGKTFVRKVANSLPGVEVYAVRFWKPDAADPRGWTGHKDVNALWLSLREYGDSDEPTDEGQFGYFADGSSVGGSEPSGWRMIAFENALQAALDEAELIEAETVAAAAVQDETEAEYVEEPIPEFPHLPALLDDLANAITADLPYAHKALGILTYVGLALSGKVELASDPHLQTRFYGVLVGPAGFGKTAIDKEIQHAFGIHGHENENTLGYKILFDAQSGQSLTELASVHPRILLAPDELADTLCPAGVPNSTLIKEMLKLYENNVTARTVIHRHKDQGEQQYRETLVTNAHFGCFGGITDARFEDTWQTIGGGASGLSTRCILAYSDLVLPALKTPSDDELVQKAAATMLRALRPLIEARSPLVPYLDQDAQNQIRAWDKVNPIVFPGRSARTLDMAKRAGMVLAACLSKTVIDAEVMRWALLFADYQIAVSRRLMPPDASTYVHRMEHSIVKYFDRVGKASKAKCQNDLKPIPRKGGMTAFNAAFSSLIQGTFLRQLKEPNRKGEPVFEKRM